MSTLRWSWILVLALGCGGATPDSPGAQPDADAVASYSGGGVAFSELEEAFPEARTPACLAARQARGGGSIEELLPCYREMAESLVLERLMLADVDDVETAVRDLEIYPALRRSAYLEAFNRRMAEAGAIEIGDSEVEAHYEANRDRYRRPGSVNLWNIFRRHRDPKKPEETMVFLRDLKQRYEAGETFAALAREHSDSETRLRDGHVGQVSEGQLPSELEKAAFALGDGDVSDPIPVRGGAVLLHVRNVVRGVEFTQEDVAGTIRQELRARALSEKMDRRIAEIEPPAGAVLLEPEALIAAMDGDDPEAPVLDIDGDRLSASEARELVGLAEGELAADLEEEVRARLLAAYEQRRRSGLLLFDLQANADAELREEVEERLRERGAAALVDELLRQEMRTSSLVDAETLETYYRDNLPHYQSPLKFRVHLWDVPFGTDPPRQLERMEELRPALDAGEIELADAVAREGGTVRDLGWRELGELTEITGKARQYLLQTQSGGFSIPYQDDEALHMLWLEEREEPRPLGYEEAAEQVREDYFRRFEEPLFRRLAEEKLAAAGFFFDEEAVRQALIPE